LSRRDAPRGLSQRDAPDGLSRRDAPGGSSRRDAPRGLSRHDAPGGLARSDAELARAIAAQVLDLLVRLVQREVVHPDLSRKTLLGGGVDDAERRAPAGAIELVLVDLDAARPGRRWSRARLLRALAQVGDVPERSFSRAARLRFLRELAARLEL